MHLSFVFSYFNLILTAIGISYTFSSWFTYSHHYFLYVIFIVLLTIIVPCLIIVIFQCAEKKKTCFTIKREVCQLDPPTLNEAQESSVEIEMHEINAK